MRGIGSIGSVEGMKSVKGIEFKSDVNAIFDTIIAGSKLCFFNTVCNIRPSPALKKFFDLLVNVSGLAP